MRSATRNSLVGYFGDCAGVGEHLFYERLTSKQKSDYYALELRPLDRQRLEPSLTKPKIGVVQPEAHQDGLNNFTTARIPKGNRKNLPRFSSAPNAIRIVRLELVVLICRFTTDCFSRSGRPE